MIDRVKHVVAELTRRIAEIYKDDKSKPVGTPQVLCAKALSKFDSLEGEVMVLSDLDLLLAVVLRMDAEKRSINNLSFIAHNDAQAIMAKAMGVSRVVDIGYDKQYIKRLQEELQKVRRARIIMNPPYGKLHLPILKTCVENLPQDGKIVSIQPVRWLQDPLWRAKKKSDAKKYRQTLEGKIFSIDEISAADATRLFAADIAMNLGIFVIDGNGGSLAYDAISKKSNGVDVSSFDRLFVENEFVVDRYDGKMQNFVPLATVLAGGSGRGFVPATRCYTMYGYFADGKSHSCKYGDGLSLAAAHNANKRRTSGRTIGATVKKFDTAVEAKNFYDFIRLDAFRFFVYVTTVDVNIHCSFLPFPKEVDAFCTSWTNARFYEYFKITAAEQKIIEATMKDLPLEN